MVGTKSSSEANHPPTPSLPRRGITASELLLHRGEEPAVDGMTPTVIPEASFAERYTLWVAF